MGVGQTLEEELNILKEYLTPLLCNSERRLDDKCDCERFHR
jgi:hypothetical protein